MVANRDWLLDLPPIPDVQAWRTDERQGFYFRARQGLEDELVPESAPNPDPANRGEEDDVFGTLGNARA